MKRLNDSQSKKIILNILIYFDNFCRKNSLHYTLAYGTLLGATRHHGFIPWDDDVDVEMPIDDYKKLLDLMHSVPDNERYQLHDMSTEKKYNEKYYYPFAKLEDSETKVNYFKTNDQGGAFIDIFPMTPLPQSRGKWYLYNKKARLLKVMLAGFNGKNRSLLRNTISKVESNLISYKFIRNSLWRLATKYEKTGHSNYVVDGTWHDFKDKNFFPKEWFKSYTSLKFEGYDLSVISNYKEMLEHDYGNWKILPPKNERVPHHDYVMYLKES